AAALLALARAHRPRIVLLGRTPLVAEPPELSGIRDEAGLRRAVATRIQAEAGLAVPAEISARAARVLANREIRATLAALADAGSPARYLAVDVQDAAAVVAALDTVRRDWGPMTAIVHGAGVLADTRIADKTGEQFDRVFDTKVAGLRALLAATAADPIAVLCVFSSVAARTGNPGQCDYAMANEVLNLVACAERARRGSACTVRAIGWGPWDGGMVDPGLKAHFEQMGVPLLPLDAGARMFVEELNSAGDEVALVVSGASGAGPLGAGAFPTSIVEVEVDGRSHAYLGDHRIDGTAVVPVAMALEWMLRGASACRPDLTSAAVRNVRVLRGIRLERFDQSGERFVVNGRQIANGASPELVVEVRGRSGTLHYSAVVEMAARPPAAPAPPALPELERWMHAQVYDGHVLFHGERFRVIRSLDGVSRFGIAGTLAGAREAGWSRGTWYMDPAVLDGGLQLAVLWARHVLGGASLPMSLGELRPYRRGLVDGPVRCVVHARQVHDTRAVCDVTLADAGGALVAEMLAVETVLRPGETASASAVAPLQA
ncbi:MAG: SDR family oxidoreductase, partial [Vicinamibacterales bacterium]